MKILEWIKRLLSKLFNQGGNIASQNSTNKVTNKMVNSPYTTINQSIQNGVNIVTSKEQPSNQKEGDFWLKILDDGEQK